MSTTLTLPSRDPYPVTKVPLGLLQIEPGTQRPVDRKHGENIKAKFDWDQFQALTVFHSPSIGLYTIIAGQHRALAARELFGDEAMVYAKVLPGGTAARRAALGLQNNIGQVKLSPVSQWHSHLRAGHAIYVAVDATITEFEVAVGSTRTEIGTVRLLERLMKGRSTEEAVEAIRKVLTVVTTAWPDVADEYRFRAPIMGTITKLLREHDQIDAVELGTRLGTKKAQHYCQLDRDRSLPRNIVAIEMVDAYNARRRAANRLPWTTAMTSR